MNLFFEESGEFKTGRILNQVGEAFQVELPGGRRTKVRAKDVLFQFDTHEPASLLTEAKQAAEEIDLDFLWEVAGDDEFVYSELGKEYFGHDLKPDEAAGLLIKLHSAPMYFYRKGKGRYKAAPEKALRAALTSIERKKQQAIIQQQYVTQLKQGILPEPVKVNVIPLLCKPDKNSIEYKALVMACEEMRVSPERLMLDLGGIKGPKELHLSRFIFEHFPHGIAFPEMTIPDMSFDLPIADIDAFSIDDVTTTEIDDAFSVTSLADGQIKIGIHIAAPALGIKPGDILDDIARKRLSTVYMPGDKITMLPDELVRRFTLSAGDIRPAVSLYVTINSGDWSVIETETKVERIRVSENLRHNDWDHLVTEESLAENGENYPHRDDFLILWNCSRLLETKRMKKRESFGLKPEQSNRIDFNFYVSDDDIVTIERRQRSAPLDRIVAEFMIFANSTWGKLLDDHGVPGIYRSQGNSNSGWMNRMQVKMLTHAAPHQGLGVDQYAWSTSPLRRYTDLVNQWQILACIQYGVTAPLSAPFRSKDASLFAIVSAFDAAYSAYSEFQSKMERYWCLRWLTQNHVRQTDAVVIRDETIRLVDIPLTITMQGMPVFFPGTQVKIDLIRWDEVDLSVEARFLNVAVDASEAIMDVSEEELKDSPESHLV